MIVMVSNDSGIAVGYPGAISVDGTGWFREGRTMGSSQAGDLRKFLRETKDQAA